MYAEGSPISTQLCLLEFIMRHPTGKCIIVDENQDYTMKMSVSSSASEMTERHAIKIVYQPLYSHWFALKMQQVYKRLKNGIGKV